MKEKVDKSMANGETIKTKNKKERKRAKSFKSEEESEGTGKPGKIPKVSTKKEKPSEPEEKENTPSNGPMKVSQINKAVFGIFKKIQGSPLSQKTINSLVVLLRDDTNEEERIATTCYVLKRLIRSTGADDLNAVAQSASYMHCILSAVPAIDPLEVLETLKRDLAVGSQQRGKEDSLAAVGQLVTAFCILQMPLLAPPKPKLMAALFEVFVSQLKGREYLVSLCADILADSFKKVPVASFEEYVWPLLQPQLNKPLSGLKLSTCDLLLAVHLAYPLILGREQLLTNLWPKKPQYVQLFELYYSGSTIHNDGLYARLAEFLVGGGKDLLVAWQQFIDAKQPLKLNAAKACAIQVLGNILLNFKDKDEQPILDLFSPTCVKFVLQELSTVKGDKSEAKKPSQKELREICYKFEGSLVLGFEKQLQDEEIKLQLLLKLLDQRLQLDTVISLPRFSQQLINQLSIESLQKLYEYYSNLLITLEAEDRVSRVHCLNQMQLILQHTKLDKEAKWRQKQLRHLLLAGLFHLGADGKPCEATSASAFSRQCSVRCEEIFLGSLLHKCSGLPALCKLLQKTLSYLNKELAKPDVDSKLHSPREEGLQKAWKKVEKLLANPSEESDVVGQTFEALILFVSLALCTRSPLSVTVLDDLIICRKNALEKGKKKADEELRWQDVLTDALLQLLLQTGHFWREFVNLVATALIPHLEPANLEQILEVLNMNKNPLSKKDEGEEESDEEMEEEQQPENSSDDSDGDDDDDDEEDEDEEDDEESHLAQIRESVRQALVNDGDADDDGASSVDWNDVDEEQGERLNAALERSFQLFRPKSRKAQAKERPTKSERIDNTSLLHFRVRALDLLELFATKKPTQPVILDVLHCVFQVYRHCSGDTKLQSLREASLKLLKKLLTKNIEFEPNQDKAPILEAIEQLMSTGEEQSEEDQEQGGKQQTSTSRQAKGEVAIWRDKCFAYLVSQGSAGGEPKDSAVWPLLVEFLEMWVANRRSRLSLASFEALFQSGQWQGVAPLAVLLASHLDVQKTRSFRRAQILKLLGEQFRRLETALKDNRSAAKEFEKQLARYVEQLETEAKSVKELKLLQKILAQGGPKREKLLEKVQVLGQQSQLKKKEAKQEKHENVEVIVVDDDEEEVQEQSQQQQEHKKKKKKSKKANKQHKKKK
ncbi:myb-binding protein 1A [Drosophila elegans]|uniref:myb-binding protein 1A n=1 Tax=Drosophila elegans TaxID=30023 RepID=UPI0007E779BE|nr:myb-binding protein 1A [Drosophila elegans]